jgi:hypothetical protein
LFKSTKTPKLNSNKKFNPMAQRALKIHDEHSRRLIEHLREKLDNPFFDLEDLQKIGWFLGPDPNRTFARAFIHHETQTIYPLPPWLEEVLEKERAAAVAEYRAKLRTMLGLP